MSNSLVGKTFNITCSLYRTVTTVKVTSTSTKPMYGKDYTVCHYTVLKSEHKQAIGKSGTFLEIDLTMKLKNIVEVV